MSKTVPFNEPHPKYPRLRIQLRSKSRFYQAWTFHDGRPEQFSTRTSSLTVALKLGAEWYRKLIAPTRKPHPRVAADSTCAEVYEAYKKTLDADKQRLYAEMKWQPIQEFWATKAITEIDGNTFFDFYTWRRRRVPKLKNHTLYKDVVLLKQILKHAAIRGVITSLPVIPKVGRIEPNPRPWLKPDEFDRLRNVSHERINEATNNPRLHRQRQDCHDFFMMLYHSNFRVDELRKLTFGQCRFGKNGKNEDILISEIDGKTGFREVISRSTGAYIFSSRQDDRLKQMDAAKVAQELVFPHKTRDAFKELLKSAKLYVGPNGQTRNLKSVRCTAIAVLVLAERNLVWIAKNAGTSVHMIDKFYVKRLTPTQATDNLTSFSEEDNPEMFVKFAFEPALPIPISTDTKRTPKVSRGAKPAAAENGSTSGLATQQILAELLKLRKAASVTELLSTLGRERMSASTLTTNELLEELEKARNRRRRKTQTAKRATNDKRSS